MTNLGYTKTSKMYSHRKYTVRIQRTHLPIREEGSGGGATDMLTLRLTFGTMRKKYCSILLHINRKKKTFLQTTAQKSILILIY